MFATDWLVMRQWRVGVWCVIVWLLLCVTGRIMCDEGVVWLCGAHDVTEVFCCDYVYVWLTACATGGLCECDWGGVRGDCDWLFVVCPWCMSFSAFACVMSVVWLWWFWFLQMLDGHSFSFVLTKQVRSCANKQVDRASSYIWLVFLFAKITICCSRRLFMFAVCVCFSGERANSDHQNLLWRFEEQRVNQMRM